MTTKQRTPRRYASTRRAAQAAQTRADVVAAAATLFGEQGWAGTTIAAIAEHAGVSVETVYAGFKNKKVLLQAAYDFAVAGDAEPIPLAERDVMRNLANGTLEERGRAGMKMLADIHSRAARVAQAANDAATAETEVAEWRTEGEARRRLDVGRSLAMVLGRDIDDETLDLMWALYSPEMFLKLTVDAGWSQEQYEREMYETTLDIAERKGIIRRRRRSRS